MAGRGMKNYNWCAKDGNVWYKDCERCRLHYYCDCDFRFETHPDAVQKADMIRAAQGRSLFSKDFDAMKRSVRQGEETKRANLYGRRRIAKYYPQAKQEKPKEYFGDIDFKWGDLWGAGKKIKTSNGDYCEPEWGVFWCGYFGAFFSSFILAYILQFCAIMTEWFFGILSVFFGASNSSAWEPVEESFFYASFGQSYIYAIALQHLIFVWMLGGSGNRWANALRFVVTAYFALASIAIPQLFISVAIGPLFIFFCFAITAKK